MSTHIHWLADPEPHDYVAATSYLALIYPPETVAGLVQRLQTADAAQFQAKDIFRASGLSLLGVSNSHVEKDHRKILAGTPLSPLLLVRDPGNGKVIVADGYHRLCSVYGFDEGALVPCRIV